MEALQAKETKPGFYKDRDGIEHPIPKKVSRYEKYGEPKPSFIGAIRPEDREVAEMILGGDRKEVLIRYIREAPVIQKHTVKEEGMTGKGERTVLKIAKGMPLAVVVAFKHGDKVYVGWSKRHSPLVDIDDATNEKVLVEVEDLIFTKQDAVKVAILRALADKLVIKGKNIKSSNQLPLPKDVERELPAFIGRVIRYFGVAPVNLSYSPAVAV